MDYCYNTVFFPTEAENIILCVLSTIMYSGSQQQISSILAPDGRQLKNEHLVNATREQP